MRTRKSNLLFIILVVVVSAFPALVQAGIPTLGCDNNWGRVFEENGHKWVLWGVEGNVWACQAGNTNMWTDHCEASVYVNANCIVLPVTWRMIEPTQNNYSFWYLDIYLDIAHNHNLKVLVMWAGIGYAAVENQFCPQYILDGTATYTRCQGLDTSDALCPSDPDTLNREKLAYRAMMNHLAVENPSWGNIVMGVNFGNEFNYMGAFYEYWWWPPSRENSNHRRCTCSDCTAAYGGQDELQFMVGQCGKYLADIMEYGAQGYDIPVYTPVAAHKYWPGWRYAEQPADYKWYADQKNIMCNFVCPSVAETSSGQIFVEEMNHFSAIWDNQIFADGIGTEWDRNQAHIEIAPWYNILWYGGLGACYWDAVGVRSIIGDEEDDIELRTKFREFWGPLLGMHYHLARLKTTDNKRFWWSYEQTHTWKGLQCFAVDQQSSNKDYGICFELGYSDIAFAGSTYDSSYTFTICYGPGWGGFKFEKGYFDRVTGAWIKHSNVFPTINGTNAVLEVTGNSGDYTQVVYRYYK